MVSADRMNAPQPYFLDHIWLIPLFPLLTAAAMLFFGRRLANNIVERLCVGSVVRFVSFFGGRVFSTGRDSLQGERSCDENALRMDSRRAVSHVRRQAGAFCRRTGDFSLIRFRR